jgi:photosystem II stability/assembly factor-like uncharacterized protein
MTPEERELRRALDARSAAPSPEFKAGLKSTFETGKPVPTVPPAFAFGVAAVLAVVAVGVLMFAGPLVHPRSSGGGPPTSPAATPTPLPTPPHAVPGVLVPPPGPIILPNSGQLSVPSGDAVWFLIQDEYLYRSTDQGDTWAQRPLPPAEGLALTEISFVNSLEGWISTGGQTGDCSANQTDIWHTSDGGATWARLGSTGIAEAQCKQGLSFVDPLHGFLGAWDGNHAPIIYRTSDGGLTWTASLPLPNPPGFTQSTNSALTAGRVQAFGSTLLVPAHGINNQTSVQAVFRSSDGGATWTYLAKTQLSRDDVEFMSASRWLQISPGQSIETTDSGATWHSYSSDYGQAAPIAPQIVFGDTMVGYATVRGGIQLTVDGGLHWTDLKTPGT